MATHIASANGNWTATTTWNDALTVSTCFLNAENGNTAVTTSYVESSAMTPGASPIDGIAVKIASRAASPSGTMSVRLALAGVTLAGTEVTVNVSDLPTCSATSGTTTPVSTAEGGWFFFKFAAPVTPAAATAYTVSAKTSVSSQVNLWRDGTAANWSRMLRSSANTSAVSAGDDFVIGEEWTAAGTGTARTVTMDSVAATDYGSNTTSQVTPALAICKGGTLAFGTSASTNYILQLSGYAIVYNGGTLSGGVNTGDIPTSSTATLQFDCTGTGDFGLVCRNGSTVQTGGSPRTSGKLVVKCKLAADLSAAGTSATVDTDTGWLNGDVVVLASTSQTGTETETAALNADATSSGLSFSAGVTNGHLGTAPATGVVALLTRNVVIKSVSSSALSFVFCGSTATVNFKWTGFLNLAPNATGKNGIEVQTTTGSFSATYCAVYNCTAFGVLMNGGSAMNNMTLQNCNIYNVRPGQQSRGAVQINAATSGTNITIDNCVVTGCGNDGSNANYAINLLDVGGTVTKNIVAGNRNGRNIGIFVNEAATIGTISDNEAYANGGSGINLNTFVNGTISGGAIWRNGANDTAGGGIIINSDVGITFSGIALFGNKNRSIYIPTNQTGINGKVIFDTITSNGDTTFPTTAGIEVATNQAVPFCDIPNSSFSVASGILTAHTEDFLFNGNVFIQAYADNTFFSGTSVISGMSTAAALSFIRSQRQDQTDGKHRSYYPQGTILSNSVTMLDTLSEEMQPTSASVKLQSGEYNPPVTSGATPTVSVYVRKNGTYNGNAPRLIELRQDSQGVTSDTVCATFSAGADTWQQLTYTLSAAPRDGVRRFIVDCDGTAGSVFVDLWAAA